MALGRHNFGTFAFGILLSTLSLGSRARLLAETPTGNIAVYVTDPTGAIVPDAKARATNQDTGGLKECVTGEKDGSCGIPELPAALYTVEVSKPGFKKYVVQNVRVE